MEIMKAEITRIREVFALEKGKKDRINCTMGFIDAAVFIPLVETKEGLSLLFEERSAMLSWQPGEISFPGGKVEPEDERVSDTALRETSEELGLSRDYMEYFGNLEPFISPLGLVIYPVVGQILDSSKIIPQESEVADVFTVPIDWFLSTEPVVKSMEMGTRPLDEIPLELLPKTYPREWRRRSTYSVYFYPYQNRVIWGLTAQVVRQFLEKIAQIK